MDPERFRRSPSWIEAYGLELALTLALYLSIATQSDLSDWINQRASISQIAGDLHQQARFYLPGALAAMSLVFALRPLLPDDGGRRWAALAVLVACAGSLGWWVLMHLDLCGCDERPAPSSNLGIALLHQFIVVAGTVAGLHEFVRHRRRSADAMHAEQLRRLALDGQLASGRLQVLLAQIEPHFLFNSLANLRRLLRTDAEAGLAMLADLMRYLEVALPRMRAERSTLDRETELARAYLAVQQVRMGPRLQVEIDVPAPLLAAPMPPMMLLTLVENALKHGLQPLPEGGRIRISARAADGRLAIRVEDTGRGLQPGAGSGTGLANLRARLRAAYGAAASLSLQLNEPRGTVATLALPESAA